MNYTTLLTKQYDIISKEWNVHLDALTSARKANASTWNKYKRANNAYYHLHTYLHRVYDELFIECDPKKQRELEVKCGKIANKQVLAKRRAEILLFEDGINDIINEMHLYHVNKCQRIVDTLHHIHVAKHNNIVHLSISKIQQLEKEDCCICLSPHKIKDLVASSCGHIYGKTCFEQIIKTKKHECEDLCCPLCRANITKLTLFRKK